MPSHQLLDWIALVEIQAAVAVLITVPVLNWLFRMPGRTLRRRRLLADLERSAVIGTRFVIRWDEHRHLQKPILLVQAARRGWQYTGQQITDAGWELLFAKAPDGESMDSLMTKPRSAMTGSETGRASADSPPAEYLPADDPMLGGLPTPDCLRSRPEARAAAAAYRRDTGLDVLDEQSLRDARSLHARWYRPLCRAVVAAGIGVLGSLAAIPLTIVTVVDKAPAGWLLVVWGVAVSLGVVGSFVVGHYRNRLRKATGVMTTGYRAVARAAESAQVTTTADSEQVGP